MNQIKTAPALEQAIMNTYLYDVIFAIVLVLVMLLVVNLIQWQGGKTDNSGKTRRLWFFIFCALALVGSLVFDYLAFFRNIAVPAFTGKYMTAMAVASVLSSVVYFLVGFAIVKISRIGTKVQSIFPKKDR
ncbi:MAG: hypothetical protein J6C35_08785 [Bacteroidales bacterium]|nr:hypothetical protein [Bacteroidales bacterium]